MKQNLIALTSGVVFGAGLIVSGMTDPTKVIGFLDVTGSWDPSLAFVMASALAVMFAAYRLADRQGHPLTDQKFHLPTRNGLDRSLILGSVLFGIGWGLSGFCPGPAITSLGFAPFSSQAQDILVFASSMVIGMIVYGIYSRSVEHNQTVT